MHATLAMLLLGPSSGLGKHNCVRAMESPTKVEGHACNPCQYMQPLPMHTTLAMLLLGPSRVLGKHDRVRAMDHHEAIVVIVMMANLFSPVVALPTVTGG
jgi:hypothetical protein